MSRRTPLLGLPVVLAIVAAVALDQRVLVGPLVTALAPALAATGLGLRRRRAPGRLDRALADLVDAMDASRRMS